MVIVMYTCTLSVLFRINLQYPSRTERHILSLMHFSESGEGEETLKKTTGSLKDTVKPRSQRAVEGPVFNEQPEKETYITPNQPITIVCDVEGMEGRVVLKVWKKGVLWTI